LVNFVTAFKYVLEADKVDPEDGLPLSVLGNGLRPYRPPDEYVRKGLVYVQPADCQDPERNAANMRAAVDSAMKFGYRVGVQTHKIMGLD
jgi:hypothetical protein